MPSIEDVVQSELSGPLRDRWLTALRRATREALGGHAVGLLDLDAVATRPGWERLDDPVRRAEVAGNAAGLYGRCAELLVTELGQFGALRQAVRDAGHGKQSAPSIRRRVVTVAPALMRLPASVGELTASPFSAGWDFVGDAVARRVYAEYRGRIPTPARDEWRLMNRLILVEYFRQCRLPEARLVAEELAETAQGLLSVRGTLVCAAQAVAASGATGEPVPLATLAGGITLRHRGLSDLLGAVADESAATPAGRGVMRRVVGRFHADPPNAVREGLVAMGQVQDARLRSYRRYEHSLTAYMGVAAIEQLLRAWATNRGVDHLRAGGLPAPVAAWLEDLNLPAVLDGRVRTLFDPARAGVRNRMMHSGFLLTASKSLQENLAVANPARYGGAAADPYAPENVARLVLECLRDLDAVAGATVALTGADLGWAGPWRLTAAELDIGRRVYCDLLPRPGGPTAESARLWAQHLSTYFRAVMPGLGQFFRLAYVGFVRPYSGDSFVLIHALGLVFEAVYRLTAHLVGVKVVQESESGDSLRFQYLMLDDAGLCSDAVVGRLVESLEPAERDVAADVLRLAVKGRNALAHGAVVRFDEPTALGLGHLFLKATQALLGAGEHHMTREAAWYRWEKRRDRGGDESTLRLEDWFAGEDEVLNRITDLGRLSPP